MADSTHLGKIVEFLCKTDMVEKLKEIGGSGLSGGTEFLALAIAELGTTYNWDVDLAVEAYIDVFELYHVKIIPKEFDAADFVQTVKVNTDINDVHSIDEYANALGFEVTPELRADFGEPTI